MKKSSIASWLIIFFPFYFVIPIGILGPIADASSPLTWVGLILAILGWIFLVRSKWPNIKKFELMRLVQNTYHLKNSAGVEAMNFLDFWFTVLTLSN